MPKRPSTGPVLGLFLVISGLLPASGSVHAQASVDPGGRPFSDVDPGAVEFNSSHSGLNRGFSWAREQAMAYVFQGDPVGKWFEAALPGREAYCMRDVSHQALGAMALGLQEHILNMFRTFAENIAPSRDWASFWEINRHGEPAPVDYRSDEDFWYNLPANFDLMQAIYSVYEWTGDPVYLEDPSFLAFYRHSLTDYVNAWDPNGDGVMESSPENGIRGIPTYWEGGGPKALTGGDLLAAQYAANRDYARILGLRGESEEGEVFRGEGERLKDLYNQAWWNPETSRFNTAVLPDGSFDASPLPLGQLYPLYFGIVAEGPRRRSMVEQLPDGEMVELNAYLPEILYRNGEYERAFKALMVQLDPELGRREYPEVSFTAVGHIVSFLMGVRPLASEGVLESKARLPKEIRWGDVNRLPAFTNVISLSHFGERESRLMNQEGGALLWRAVFAGRFSKATANGEPVPILRRWREGEGPESFVEVQVAPGREVVVRVGESR